MVGMADVTVRVVRIFLGERIPQGAQASETNFSDEELAEIVAMGTTFNEVMAYAWEAKCGILSDLIDANEDGSIRQLSQAFEHARKQANAFGKKATDEGVQLMDGLRFAGAGLFSPYEGTASERTISQFCDDPPNTRPYPLYRFPRVIR